MSDIAWQFNEAVSLLREARATEMTAALAEEIDESLPAIQAALNRAAELEASTEDWARRHADCFKVVLQRELNCGFGEAQRLAWVLADALATDLSRRAS